MDEWNQTWQRLQTGDPAAYDFLLQRLGRAVWAYLRRMTGRDDLADELFSRTWLRLVETGDRISSPRAIRQYVLSIARRQWLDELRRRQRDVVASLAEHDPPADATATPSALEALAREEDAHRLRRAVDLLPEPLREVVVLRTYAELTFHEIAELLDIPLGTTLTRMRRATHRLAAILSEPASDKDGEHTPDE